MKSLLSIIFIILIFISLIFNFFSYYNLILYSPDSWSYYDISNSIFEDFYKTNIIRQHQIITEYSISFPPLFPFIIRIFNIFLKLGIRTQYILNLIFLILLLFVSYNLIKKKLNLDENFSLFCSLILLSNREIIEETFSGRSSILSLLLFFLLINLFFLKKINIIKIFFVATISGLMVLNRFDFFLSGLMLGIILFSFKKINFANLVLYYLFFLITISPWIIYSFTKFNTFFVTDNFRTFFLSNKIYVLDFIDKNQFTLNILNSPIIWLIQRLISLFIAVKTLFQNKLFTLSFFLLFVLLIRKKKSNKSEFNKKIYSNLIKILLIIITLNILPPILNNYYDRRYFIFLFIFVEYIFFIYLYSITNKNLRHYILLFLSIFLLILSLRPIKWKINQIKFVKKYKNLSYWEKGIPSEFKNNHKLLKNYKTLVDEPNSMFFFLASYYQIPIIIPPSNINICNINKIVENYKVRFLYSTCKSFKSKMEVYFYLKEIEPNLYEIKRYKNFPLKNCSIKIDKTLICD